MVSPFRHNRGFSGLFAVTLLTCAACSDAVQLVGETETGGVVTYLYKEDRGADGVTASEGGIGSHRKEMPIRLYGRAGWRSERLFRDVEHGWA